MANQLQTILKIFFYVYHNLFPVFKMIVLALTFLITTIFSWPVDRIIFMKVLMTMGMMTCTDFHL